MKRQVCNRCGAKQRSIYMAQFSLKGGPTEVTSTLCSDCTKDIIDFHEKEIHGN